jgi:Glycosyltransferases involved in cell wall biogenesis
MQVDILLATYNGEKFIRQQLDSLLEQTYQGWRLLAHDDGSTDNTVKILKEYNDKYPDQIFLLADGIKCGGAKENFSYLMTSSNAKYIMFCDQDDVWLKNKVEVTLDRMKKLEQQYPDKALLIHSDLKVANEKLDVISNSMFDYQRLPQQIKSIDQIVVQNNITGCTVMVNKCALDVSLPIGENAIMHDWWIGIKVLQSNGIIDFIPEPLILYRQHQENAVGSKKIDIKYFLLKFLNLRNSVALYKNIWNQAKSAGVNVSGCDFFFNKLMAILRRLFNL